MLMLLTYLVEHSIGSVTVPAPLFLARCRAMVDIGTTNGHKESLPSAVGLGGLRLAIWALAAVLGAAAALKAAGVFAPPRQPTPREVADRFRALAEAPPSSRYGLGKPDSRRRRSKPRPQFPA